MAPPSFRIDRDYRARLLCTVSPEHTGTERGTFRPDPSESRLCAILPSCCLSTRDFNYSVAKYDDVVRIRVETQRYRQPVLSWSVEGISISGSGSVSVSVIAEIFAGHRSQYQPKTISLQYTLKDGALELRTRSTDANFDVTVGCSISDGSIAGNVKVNVIAKPSVRVGFARLSLDSI